MRGTGAEGMKGEGARKSQGGHGHESGVLFFFSGKEANAWGGLYVDYI